MAENDHFLMEMFPTDEDVFRCWSTFSTLARHFNETLILTGGVAVNWHAARNECRVGKRPFNDIDIVVEHISDLPQSLRDDFLVAHLHPSHDRGKILLQLVDEKHRVRVDVFTPSSPSLMSRVRTAEVAGVTCGILAAEDLAAKLLSILYAVTTGKYVDPKYYDKFNVLSAFADKNVVRDIWSDYRKEEFPHSFDVAAGRVHQRIANDHNLLRQDSYSQDVAAACPWCSHSDSFPASPRSRIYEVLGYV